MSKCSIPTDNYPFRSDTFLLIQNLSIKIRRYSNQYNVPPIAVAGAIADEYNTQVFPKAIIDWFQEKF